MAAARKSRGRVQVIDGEKFDLAYEIRDANDRGFTVKRCKCVTEPA